DMRARGTDLRVVIEVHGLDDERAEMGASDEVEVRVDPRSIPVAAEGVAEPVGQGSPSSNSNADGILRTFQDLPIDLDDVVHDFYHHIFEITTNRVDEIEMTQRRLGADQLVTSRESSVD
ncbi:hypothetical protein Tco_0289127, partial [Tanacetum coccineum]